jgi:hypothetical protein
LIYDKTHEIKYHAPQKIWMHDKWRLVLDEDGQPVWDGEVPVIRIEIRYRRPALGQMKQEGVFHGIDSAWDLEERLPGLWAYAVGHVEGGQDGLPDGWLRCVLPTGDTNRSRWSVHPDWQVIQTGFAPEPLEKSEYELRQEQEAEYWQAVDEELTARPLAPARYTPFFERESSQKKPVKVVSPALPTPQGEALPMSEYLLPFVRKRKRQVNMERMFQQIGGCIVTVEAWRLPKGEHWPSGGVEPDVSDTFHYIYAGVLHQLEKKGSFLALVQKKRVNDYELESVA